MNDKLPELQKGQQGPNAQDPSRRRLLRAAASAAPLIATLPCGAAAQVASTYQCIIKDKDNTTVADVTTALDRWYRSKAFRVVWRKRGSPDITTYRFSTDANVGPWYLESSGMEFKPADYEGYQRDTTTQVWVLRLYRPNDATSPTGIVPACDSTAQTGYPPNTAFPTDQCVYPFAKREKAGGDTGNMGLTGSCWTSIAPPGR